MNIKTSSLVVIVIALFITFLNGCTDDNENKHMQQHEMSSPKNSEIVRDVNIDVSIIDDNRDGMVFQCPMDWEVISDKAESCPLCNMDLKEYSIADAQMNLKGHVPQNH